MTMIITTRIAHYNNFHDDSDDDDEIMKMSINDYGDDYLLDVGRRPTKNLCGIADDDYDDNDYHDSFDDNDDDHEDDEAY